MKDLTHLRSLQLYLQLFNVANCYMIFLLKLVCLVLSIFNGYAVIAHRSQHPVLFGIVYSVLTFDPLILYTVVYDKAFKTPSQFAQAVRRMLLGLPDGTSIVTNKFIQRRLKSVPKLGIKVGEFHTLERTSTPDFVGFVAVNIVNMLVAYG